MKGRLQLNPDMLLSFIIQPHFERVRFAGVIEKDEVALFPKGGIINELLKVDEFQVVNIQPGFLLRLADRSLLQPLPQFHMSDGNNVFARPFVTL